MVDHSSISPNRSPRWANISPYYFIVINSSKHGIVRARIPDKISFSLESEWSNLFPSPQSRIADFLKAVFGVSTVTEVASLQIWQGTSPVTLRLELEFVADYNAEVEIMDNIKKLGKMVLPRRGVQGEVAPTALLRPPGPRLSVFDLPSNLSDIKFDPESDIVSIEVGGFLRFKGVILKKLDIEFDGSMFRTGHPIRAKCDVEFSTFFIIVAETFDQLFVNSSNP